MINKIKVWHRSQWIEVAGETYHIRQKLKSRKYEWNTCTKVWAKKVSTSEEIQKEIDFLRQIAEVEEDDSIPVAIQVIDICPFSFYVFGKNVYGKNNIEIYIEEKKDTEKAIEVAKKIHTILNLEDKGDVCVHCGAECIFCAVDEFLEKGEGK